MAIGWAPAAVGFGRAREALERALSLAPDLADAHAGIGWLRMTFDWDWRGAQASYARALELAPGNTAVLRRMGTLAASLGRIEEGIGHYRQALERIR